MQIKEVTAGIILDSREEKTIEISVNQCYTSAPEGKSTGKYEKAPYKKSVEGDTDFINSLKLNSLPEINNFEDLEKIEDLFKEKIGANTLFCLEASILKALAKEQNKELWEILNPELDLKKIIFPRLLSNTIGGGAHSQRAIIKPDFQEFLFTSDKPASISYRINRRAHEITGETLKKITMNSGKLDYENAWQTDLDNEKVLDVMANTQKKVSDESATELQIGIDVAASQFFNKEKQQYEYKNREQTLTREEQIDYILELIKKYSLFYIEDPLDEEDFQGFSELLAKIEGNCMITGDDLTVTNLERVQKAIAEKSINALIVKPNQTGSLIEVKKVIGLCKESNIYIVVSHRAAETLDNTLADLAFAFQADFIKIPVIGKEREAKINRLKDIEAKIKEVVQV